MHVSRNFVKFEFSILSLLPAFLLFSIGNATYDRCLLTIVVGGRNYIAATKRE